ncbi:MmcQ/YjbR family DNA-binding protein [Pedobacter sp. CFBP9032]|uniref:MmcQ/YjbR family DNA-binding protein n=1 Tax=Pedobacter sp. CFBP9032 TaxID=3096539 RepID=UPI002A69C6BF|nr:MmcQ/YjbR family DNA-binding protein [Pedobacter sp. CFBP9032]MDY0905562.1 MmcQ/YjbR family DNA-binding protein [Pedobacter sp. CFBP9032]
MDIESFREYCLNLPGTTEGMKWGYLCFMIEEKIYVIIAIDEGTRFSIKCNPDDFDSLTARNGIAQAYHLAKRQWIGVEHLDVLNDQELKSRVADSRALVVAKLPKKTQAKYI